MTRNSPVAVISMGDPAGIGPEIIVKSFIRSPGLFRRCVPLVAGSAGLLREYAGKYGAGFTPEAYRGIKSLKAGVLFVADTGSSAGIIPGKPGRASGKAAAECIERAAGLVQDFREQGVRSCLVTAPVSKEEVMKSRPGFRGHTEFLAELAGGRRTSAGRGARGGVVMLMVSRYMKVLLATRHVPLDELGGAFTEKKLVGQVKTACGALGRYFGIKSPRALLCNYNPHSGEGGKLGRQERDVIIPAVKRLARDGFRAEGPLPADVVFRMGAEELKNSLVVCCYHDQAMVPLKILFGMELVNLTCGLPFVRTSPAHGTAFDIAGRGIADPAGMTEAIKLASALALK